MNVLVLRPGNRNLGYAVVSLQKKGQTLSSGRISEYRLGGEDPQSMGEAVAEIWEQACRRRPVHLIGIEVRSGGAEFVGPVVADESALMRLECQTHQAPLHLPVVISLAHSCRRVLPEIPVVLVFQAAFFADLPQRERSYGIDPELAERLELRRFGYYGLYHGAACSHMTHLHKQEHQPRRIISICLDQRNELAAVVGRRPVLVTSGATALEGLPGLTTSGEIDPSIILTLSRTMKWGPEQINDVLTRHSGLLGLCGRAVTTLTLLRSQAAPLRLAREVLQYRLLLACGSAIAAMAGLDEIVFSGCYGHAAGPLGAWLSERLGLNTSMGQVPWHISGQPLEQIIAEQALTALSLRLVSARMAS